METPTPKPAEENAALLRCAQPCDTDCAYFAALEALPEWGLCRDPRCPPSQGLARPGRECPRFAVWH